MSVGGGGSSQQQVAQLAAVMQGLLTHLHGGGRGSGGGRDGGKKDILYGKGFEMMAKFGGGETEWHEWSGDFRTMVQTKSEMAGEAMNYVKAVGKSEKDALSWMEVLRSLKDAADLDDEDAVTERFKDLGKVAKELYRWLKLTTEGEAKLVVMAEEEEGDGIKVWGQLHAKYNKKTLTRLMRL